METFLFVLAIVILILIAYLVFINQKLFKKVVTYKRDEEKVKISDERYYELNNEIQLIIVVASIIILIGGFIGYNSIDSIKDDIQDKMDEYVDKLNGYETIISNYDTLIPSLEKERDATFTSLIKTKTESEKTKENLTQLQNDYRLNAKTYFVKGIKINQKLLKDNSQIGQIYYKDLIINNPKIPSVFSEEPFISVVGIGDGLITIDEISKEYFKYNFSGFVEADNIFYAMLETVDTITISQEEKELLVKLKSLLLKSIKHKRTVNKRTEASTFDLIIIEGMKNP